MGMISPSNTPPSKRRVEYVESSDIVSEHLYFLFQKKRSVRLFVLHLYSV